MKLTDVKHKIHFNDGTSKVYDFNELLVANLDGSTIKEVSPMVILHSSPSKEYVEVFIGDVIELDITEMKESDGFWGSNAGHFVKEHGYTKIIMTMLEKGSSYDVNFEKEGKLVTDFDHYKYKEDDLIDLSESELLEIYKPYTQNSEGTMFIRYILSKGGKVI